VALYVWLTYHVDPPAVNPILAEYVIGEVVLGASMWFTVMMVGLSRVCTPAAAAYIQVLFLKSAIITFLFEFPTPTMQLVLIEKPTVLVVGVTFLDHKRVPSVTKGVVLLKGITDVPDEAPIDP